MEDYLQQQMHSLMLVPKVPESESGSDDIDERALQELKHMVKKWTEIENNIKKITKHLQGWKHMKADYEEKITKFMRDNDLEGLNTKEGLIQCRVTQRKKRMTKVTMREALEENIQDPELKKKIIKLTIQRFLGNDFKVVASSGHVRDLPVKRMGVNTNHPSYAVEYEDTRRKKIQEILGLCKGAEVVLLCTDPDREGEAIAWHLQNIIKSKYKSMPVHRVSTNEITWTGVQNALLSQRNVDLPLVEAQQARRAIDRLVGYSFGDSLHKMLGVRKRVTSGRVQCAVMYMINQHNNAIDTFKSKTLGWSIIVNDMYEMCNEGGEKALTKTRDAVLETIKSITGRTLVKTGIWRSSAPVKAPVPFTTATLQQEADWKLGFPIGKTMTLAQRLYDSRFVTYIRTDSPRISGKGAELIKEHVVKAHGLDMHEYNRWSSIGGAHEAIRPTQMAPGLAFKSADAAKLYALIFQRSVASQMKPGRLDTKRIIYTEPSSGKTFFAEQRILSVESFLKFYNPSKVTMTHNVDVAFPLKVKATAVLGMLVTSRPPKHLSEGTLIKLMETSGIGRPSTYVSTIYKLLAKGMIGKQKFESSRQQFVIDKSGSQFITVTNEKETNCIVLTEFGKQVLYTIVQNYAQLADAEFTAMMEQTLDEVANGKKRYVDILDFF
eukprot:gene19596-26279_t